MRMRSAALELLRSQGAAQCLLLAQTFGVSKERAMIDLQEDIDDQWFIIEYRLMVRYIL